MEFWSKGLGRRSMVIDIGTEHVEDAGNELVMTGTVKAPVNWNYIISMERKCWEDFFQVALSRSLARYLASPDKISLFVSLTAHVLVFLVRYPIVWAVGLLRPSAEPRGPDQGGSRFMQLVAEQRKAALSGSTLSTLDTGEDEDAA